MSLTSNHNKMLLFKALKIKEASKHFFHQPINDPKIISTSLCFYPLKNSEEMHCEYRYKSFISQRYIFACGTRRKRDRRKVWSPLKTLAPTRSIHDPFTLEIDTITKNTSISNSIMYQNTTFSQGNICFVGKNKNINAQNDKVDMGERIEC